MDPEGLSPPHFVSFWAHLRTRWKMQLFITLRPFFISCSPVVPYTWHVFTNTWKLSRPWGREQRRNGSHSLPSGTARQWQCLTCRQHGHLFSWLPQNCAFQAHFRLVNGEQAGWRIEGSLGGIVHLVCGLFETDWLSPLNLSAFATRKETDIKAIGELRNETSCHYCRKWLNKLGIFL